APSERRRGLAGEPALIEEAAALDDGTDDVAHPPPERRAGDAVDRDRALERARVRRGVMDRVDELAPFQRAEDDDRDARARIGRGQTLGLARRAGALGERLGELDAMESADLLGERLFERGEEPGRA